MGRRAVTAAEFEGLLRAGLSAREFRRSLYALENAPGALRLLDRRNRLDTDARLYRNALGAACARVRDGSIQRYQLQWLAQSFTAWRLAAAALAELESPRRLPAAAE
ncbi:hypothetical protein J2847_004091 [Azospirillum agricola]|uniref:hypothetical protein n=1 Tax=Azospirillum agricola TaxID=1720247 RepID=UPI001AE81B5C|nr:hypothetical protein [Azospirillum agricola]MBP2230782.1 hypothetical protein [Azospirillum agricola]